MTELGDFFTAEEAEEGVKLPLYNKYGEKTDEWLLVRGVDSQQFRTAKLQADRDALEAAQEKDDDLRRASVERIKREVLASLVIDWSPAFHDQMGAPSKENLVDLFAKAPQIADEVDRFAGNRRLFFSLRRSSS